MASYNAVMIDSTLEADNIQNGEDMEEVINIIKTVGQLYPRNTL